MVKNAQRDAAKGKKLLDELKRDGETLMRSNPKSDRVQPYKAQYMRLCKLYVDAMKVRREGGGAGGLFGAVSRTALTCATFPSPVSPDLIPRPPLLRPPPSPRPALCRSTKRQRRRCEKRRRTTSCAAA